MPTAPPLATSSPRPPTRHRSQHLATLPHSWRTATPTHPPPHLTHHLTPSPPLPSSAWLIGWQTHHLTARPHAAPHRSPLHHVPPLALSRICVRPFARSYIFAYRQNRHRSTSPPFRTSCTPFRPKSPKIPPKYPYFVNSTLQYIKILTFYCIFLAKNLHISKICCTFAPVFQMRGNNNTNLLTFNPSD